MYAKQGNPMCPVASFKQYMAKQILSATPFYNVPVTHSEMRMKHGIKTSL